MSDNWILVASTDSETFTAQTGHIYGKTFLYRAICKWLIRGNASKILKAFWEYIDQDDNEIEKALLEQLETQAEHQLDDPQTTNVRTRDYSIDMTVENITNKDSVKKFKLTCVLYVYLQSLKKKLRIDEQVITFTMIRLNDKMERISIATPERTPMEAIRRVSKRSSKQTV